MGDPIDETLLTGIAAGDGFACAASATTPRSNLPESTAPTYATDEDIAVRAGGDFVTLCPAWQVMAQGVDGFFAPGLPWALNSTAVNFQANGVKPNQVVSLTGPKANFQGGGQLLAIDSVVGNTINLRRLHKDLNVGMPPAPAGGLTNVTFTINTLDPQTEEASFDIKRRFGIDENIVDRTSTWIYDLRDLRMTTVLQVLLARYTAEARGDKGDWVRKIDLIRCELSGVLDRVEVRWGKYGTSEPPTTVGFGMRLVR
jgi:hypothetical protein